MAARPEKVGGAPEYFLWATQTLQQTVPKNGTLLVLPNKTSPTEEFKSSGLKWGEPLNYPEVNYQFDGYSKWFQHLDQRYAVDDIHMTASAETVGQISARLGGTWVLLATDTAFTPNIKIYRKTA